MELAFFSKLLESGLSGMVIAMNRLGFDWLAPYVSDALAFLILGVSVTVIFAGATFKGEVAEAALYHSGLPISAVTSL